MSIDSLHIDLNLQFSKLIYLFYNDNINIYSHENQIIMDLTAIQLQALIRQAQDQYLIAFATKKGQSLIGPIVRREIGKHLNKNIID